MKLFYIALGVGLLVATLLFVKDDLKNHEVRIKGEVVLMKLIEQPSSCIGTKSRYFIAFMYDKRVYTKSMSGSFCQEHNIGDQIEMRFLKGSERILFPEETVTTEFVSEFIFGLVALYIIYYGFKYGRRKNNE